MRNFYETLRVVKIDEALIPPSGPTRSPLGTRQATTDFRQYPKFWGEISDVPVEVAVHYVIVGTKKASGSSALLPLTV